MPASLLLFVNQHSGAPLRDHGQRHFQLLTAVAAQRSEDIAGEALGMNAHKRRRGMNIAHHQGHRVFLASVEVALEPEDAEVAPTGREVGGGDLLNGRSAHKDIIAAG